MLWRDIEAARRVLETERGAVVQDWGGKVPVALAYPNSYAVGMSSLAIHGLYRWLNAMPGVACERTFAAWDRRSGPNDPLLTLESQRPVQDVALLAFSVSFEMDYFNLVAMLQRANLPVLAEERGEGDPLVVLGGPAVSANPEPVAALADAVVIGEAECLLDGLIACVRESWQHSRAETLANLASLPGVYVPSIHQGEPIQRQLLADLDAYPLSSSIVAPRAEFGDMHLIELSRGCGRGCRFCLAGYWYRPIRERSLDVILAQAQEGLERGLKIGLVAAAVSDYTPIEELVARLRAMGASFSVSSLRVAPLSPSLVRGLKESGSRSITLAPEAGSERLRRVINKCISHDDILRATELVTEVGFESLKLYFMLGLPEETDEDIRGLIDLAREVQQVFTREVVVNLTPFVPKAHTPFQRVAMAPAEVMQARLERINTELRSAKIQVRAETIDSARVQGILARGDRQVGQVLATMPKPSPKRFERALERRGLAVEDYLGEREPQAPLPWSFIGSRVRAAYLTAERQRAEQERLTELCIPGSCARCGACPPSEES
jgi:radical SAM superfamily enzyme YgiQ (UPF0313 family)